MTEAEALAIAVRALVGAFVPQNTSAPAPPLPILKPARPPRRPKKVVAREPTLREIVGEIPVGEDGVVPPISVADMEALFAQNRSGPPPGYYDPSDKETDAWRS